MKKKKLNQIKKNVQKQLKFQQKLISKSVDLSRIAKEGLSNSFRLNKQPNPRTVSLSVELPVLKEYKQIDLKKTSSYQRISRLKSKNIIQGIKQSQNKAYLFFNQKGKQINQQIKIFSEIQSFKNKSSFQLHRYETQPYEQSHWKQQIKKYIDAKQKSQQALGDKSQFPLMKLSRKNQLLRKIRTNQRLDDEKPDFIKEMQKQEMFTEDLVDRKKILPKVIQIRNDKKMSKQNTKTRKSRFLGFEQQTSRFNSLLPSNRKKTIPIRQQNSISTSSQKSSKFVKPINSHISQKKSFFKQAILNASKSEKILINFIGNYFKQKYCPQKRFSFQNQGGIRFKQNQVIPIQIKNVIK